MTCLQFNQILPLQKMPILAQDHIAELPKRAQAFCHPFRHASQQGCYFFPPIDFQFKLTDKLFELRTINDSGSYKTVTIDLENPTSGNTFILLSDISPEQSSQCLTKYRDRIKQGLGSKPIDVDIDIDNFGFYEVMLNVLVEEEPFGVFIQLWLGGVIMTEPGCSVWIKQATNVLMDPGYSCLDAQIDTSLWQGWLAIVLKPNRKNVWVSVDKQQPICQVLGYPEPITKLDNIPFHQVANETFLQPLDWHIFDRNYGVKPGKYQRMIRKET